jgi:D-alanyl-D-alanine carboxypeptidase
MGRTKTSLSVVALAMIIAARVAAATDSGELPGITATAAIAVDTQSGEVLFARNPTLPLPPASTTKLLTALIALRQLSPDSVLSVSTYASTMPPTKAGLKPGWRISARDLMYALMLHSANDASVVIAEGIAGSVPNFARMMNATARSLGATDSNFVTPNGLPTSNHYTTVHDMALIMGAVIQTPGMRDILSTRTAVIQPLFGSNRRIGLRSTNRLLWRDDLHVIGKTGWTREARRCFVGVGSANGHEVIVAVLGSRDVWRDVEALVTYGLARTTPGGDWHDQSGWQEAATQGGGTGWSLPGAQTGELAEVMPPPRSFEDRRRLSALVAPTTGYGRRKQAKAAPPVAARAQGDGGDLRGTTMRYALHLGSYRSKARADELRSGAARSGYRAEVESVAGTYRVTVPNLGSRDAARQAARKLSRTLHVDPVIVATR